MIYYLIIKPKLGFFLAFIQCLAVSSYNLFYFHYNNLPSNFNSFDDNLIFYNSATFEKIYFPALIHYNTHVIGLICAWLVQNKIKPNFLNYKFIRLLINVFAFSVFPIFVFSLHMMENSEKGLNRYFSFFIPIIDKLISSIPFFWLFYSGCLNYNGKF